MSDKIPQRITALFVSSNVLLALALILPRLLGWSRDLAGATAAVLSFVALYMLSFSLSFYLLGLTLVSSKQLSGRQRLMGVQPFLLVAIIGLYLLSHLQP
jgi:uncharacterized membrane protein YozB (DUF420 family)